MLPSGLLFCRVKCLIFISRSSHLELGRTSSTVRTFTSPRSPRDDRRGHSQSPRFSQQRVITHNNINSSSSDTQNVPLVFVQTPVCLSGCLTTAGLFFHVLSVCWTLWKGNHTLFVFLLVQNSSSVSKRNTIQAFLQINLPWKHRFRFKIAYSQTHPLRLTTFMTDKTKENLNGREYRPEIRYSFLPVASKFTPQTADTWAVKTASMSWLGPLNIWNQNHGGWCGSKRSGGRSQTSEH